MASDKILNKYAAGLDCTDALAEIPVRMTRKDTNQVETLILRELDGLERDKYLNNLRSRTSIKDGTRVNNFTGLQSSLLSRCVYRTNSDGEEELVPAKEIEGWPATTQSKLYEAAMELSGLKDDSEDEAKND
jgi:hypothetical protein